MNQEGLIENIQEKKKICKLNVYVDGKCWCSSKSNLIGCSL